MTVSNFTSEPVSTGDSADGIRARWLGQINYQEALELQKNLASSLSEKGILLGCEHPACITLGKAANAADEIIDMRNDLPVYQIERGGKATIHSPGQLVIYPIINLRALQISVRHFVELLLMTSQLVLESVGIGSTIQDQGLHTPLGKIASVGIRIQNGISYHGISINVTNDLSLFDQIRTCGISLAQVDSCANHSYPLAAEKLFPLWVHVFHSRLGAFI